jgi:hypothetical protein
MFLAIARRCFHVLIHERKKTPIPSVDKTLFRQVLNDVETTT